jgi:hypothetical protein
MNRNAGVRAARKTERKLVADKMDVVSVICQQFTERSRDRAAASNGGVARDSDSHERRQSSNGLSMRIVPRMK